MRDNLNKGKSPFYPGQPVPVDFFVGCLAEIERITRAVKQADYLKPEKQKGNIFLPIGLQDYIFAWNL